MQFLLAVGMSLVMLAGLANVLVQRYAVAAVQAALEEGARAGGRFDAGVADCSRRAREALRALLGGRYGDEVRIRCDRTAEAVHARATGRFPGWAPFVPDLDVEMSARSVAESR